MDAQEPHTERTTGRLEKEARRYSSAASSGVLGKKSRSMTNSASRKGAIGDRAALVVDTKLDPEPIAQLECFQRSRIGVDDPVMLHAMLGVETTLEHAIDAATGGRDNLAAPVGHDIDWALIGAQKT